MPIVLVSVLLVAVLVLLVTELLPVDLTALGVLVALATTGLLTPTEALAGFAHPAPVTIAVLFVVTQGLVRTGALDAVTTHVLRVSRGRSHVLLAVCLVLVGGMSSFINNTPIVVMFVPIIMAACCEYSLSPSKFLLPVSFVSILAGTSTLIGTSTNLIVSDLAAEHGMRPIGMFELSVLGIPIAIAGAAYLQIFSSRLLRAHKEPVCELRQDEYHRYVSELRIPPGSPLIGRNANKALAEEIPSSETFEVLRNSEVIDVLQRDVGLQAHDILLVKASASDLIHVLDRGWVTLPTSEDGTLPKPYDNRSLILELVVVPNSRVNGRRLERVIAEFDAHISLLGVKRRHVHFVPQKVHSLRLSVGDILLVQTPADHLDQLRASDDYIVVEDVVRRIINRKKAPLALAIFLAMVAAATFGITDILVAALSGAFLMLLTRCVSLREAYRSLDARVLLLIIGTLALGAALSKTGAAALYTKALLMPFVGASPTVVLSALILLASVLSLLLSNNSTAVLLVPIALSTAETLGTDPRPFIIGICFGASACYASPIGYQTNLLVYGPGGYSFADYVRLGLPLNVFVWLVASWWVPILWPF